MKKLSLTIQKIEILIQNEGIRSVSFDIDGTVYPIIKVQRRWWKRLLLNPQAAWKFLAIRKKWEERRSGNAPTTVYEDDVEYFEHFLISLLDSTLVPEDVLIWIESMKQKGLRIFFLSDHGASVKLKALGLQHLGQGINCLSEVGELKPHHKITQLMFETYGIDASTHLHLGDRWTDEEQAKLMKCHFTFFSP